MTNSEGSEWGHADVLLNWYYDEETGGFYLSPSDKNSRSYNPNLFSTIEALWALLQSPTNSDQHKKVQQTIRFICDELSKSDDLCPANPELEDFVFEHSVISVSYSLVVLARARKFVQRHSIDEKYRRRLDECISTHLEFVCDAQRDDGGWGIVPKGSLPDDAPNFGIEIYCTAIALMAIQSCTLDDFKLVGFDKHETEQIIANGFGALAEIAEIPDPLPENPKPETVTEETIGEATLVATWMLSFTRIIWDRRLWNDHWQDPMQFDEFNKILKKSSAFLLSVVRYDMGHDGRLVEFQCEHKINYPHRSNDGSIRKKSFPFELPSGTIASVLALSPAVSVWSDECQYIKDKVEDLITSRRQSVIMDNQSSIKVHQFSGPIVTVTFVEAAEQGISMVMRHFIRWGDVPDIADPKLRDNDTTSLGLSHSNEDYGFLTQLGHAGDRLIWRLKAFLSRTVMYFFKNPTAQAVLFVFVLSLVFLSGNALDLPIQTIFLLLVLISVPATIPLSYTVLYNYGAPKVQAGITSLIPSLVLAGATSMLFVELQTAIISWTLIVQIISASITLGQWIDGPGTNE